MKVVVLPGDNPAPGGGKKSRNKFKPAEAVHAVAETHAASGGVSKKRQRSKKNKGKREGNVQVVDTTVAVQPDAPAAAVQPQLQRRQQQQQPPAKAAGGAPAGPAAAAAAAQAGRHVAAPGGKKGKGGGSLLQQMRQRLQGGRFRWLNETLYTTGGAEALGMMHCEPELMEQYHEGFREQTKGWPVQPVDQAIRWLAARPPSWVVADLGCGDAKIAATVRQHVHSFDLAATAPGVVACNMADIPLPPGAVDVAVFCLSLMGTDYGLFLEEAARILKPTGWLWIAEVQSRFVSEAGRSVLPAFEEALGRLGFVLKRKDTSNTHFLVLEAQRQQVKQQQQQQRRQQQQGMAWPALRPCQYKKR